MSEQADGHLQLPSSFNFKRDTTSDYKRKSIDFNRFQEWHKTDMYASTYARNHSPESQNPSNAHIPGYQGYIPKVRVESLEPKSYANTTRDVLNKPEINMNRSHLATTGFNLNRDALVDHSKVALSHKYGKTAQLQKSNPAWIAPEWKSTTKAAYLEPSKLNDMTYRSTDKNLQTSKKFQKTSGWQQNRDFWDGQGWKNNKILYPASLTSEYRDRQNPEMKYHRKVETDKMPQIKPRERVYQYNK